MTKKVSEMSIAELIARYERDISPDVRSGILTKIRQSAAAKELIRRGEEDRDSLQAIVNHVKSKPDFIDEDYEFTEAWTHVIVEVMNRIKHPGSPGYLGCLAEWIASVKAFLNVTPLRTE